MHQWWHSTVVLIAVVVHSGQCASTRFKRVYQFSLVPLRVSSSNCPIWRNEEAFNLSQPLLANHQQQHFLQPWHFGSGLTSISMYLLERDGEHCTILQGGGSACRDESLISRSGVAGTLRPPTFTAIPKNNISTSFFLHNEVQTRVIRLILREWWV